MSTQVLQDKPVANLSLDFWNNLHRKYPKGMNIFFNWIDRYKKRNNVQNLFNDLPYAFQIGMWVEFVFDQGYDLEVKSLFAIEWKAEITDFIRLINE